MAAEQATRKAAEEQDRLDKATASHRTETYKGKDLIAWTAEIEKDPQNPKLYYGRGMLHQLRDERTNAIDDYSEAIALDPKYINAYLQRSSQYSMIADFEKAIADADKVISIAPNLSSGYETRAFAELDTEQYNKQIEDLRKALVLHRAAGAPKGSLAYMYNSLGDAYLNLGRFSEAKKCATEAIKDTDDTALEHYAYCLRAVVSCFQHDYEAANEDLTKITSGGDATSWDLHFLALYQASLGEMDLAEKTLQRAMEKETFPARAYRLRGEIFKAVGQYKRSFQEHSSATSLQQFPPGYRQRALASIALGQYVSALNDLQKSLKLNPKSSRTLSYMALVEFKLGKEKEAAKHMRQAFETDSQVPIVYATRAAWRVLARGSLIEALADCNKALTQDPWLKEGYVARAVIYRQLGQNDLADKDMEKSKTLLTHIEY